MSSKEPLALSTRALEPTESAHSPVPLPALRASLGLGTLSPIFFLCPLHCHSGHDQNSERGGASGRLGIHPPFHTFTHPYDQGILLPSYLLRTYCTPTAYLQRNFSTYSVATRPFVPPCPTVPNLPSPCLLSCLLACLLPLSLSLSRPLSPSVSHSPVLFSTSTYKQAAGILSSR